MDLKAIRRWFWLGMMAVPVMFCSSDIALAEMHIFSAPDGRAIEAEIVSYDAHTGLVVLERMDGKRVKINPSGFVEPDQKYVTGWVAVNAFLADDILEIECDDRQVNEWKEKETKTIRYTNGQNETGFIHNIIKYE